jgi:hypothetical protein
MTHCPEWEDLFKKRPDACVESADYRRKVEKWLNTLEEIRKRGIQVTTKIFPEGAHRVLLALDDTMREKTLNYICHKLERGEKITAPDLKKSIAVWEGKEATTSCPVRENKTNELSPPPDNDVKPPEAPTAKTLKERFNPPEQPAPAKEPEPVVEPPPRPPTPAPCLSLKGCPDFQNHVDTSNKLLGRVCNVIKIPCNQLPGPDKECPLERKERLKGTAPEQFVRAGELIEEIAGAKIIRPAPLAITAVKLNKEEADQRIRDTRGYLTPKDWDAFEDIRKTGELGESYVETFIGLIWFATMGGV